jgi:hypothetical protein
LIRSFVTRLVGAGVLGTVIFGCFDSGPLVGVVIAGVVEVLVVEVAV